MFKQAGFGEGVDTEPGDDKYKQEENIDRSAHGKVA
jgi:hypothetical protein